MRCFMKKIAILAIGLMLILTGCGKKTPEDLVAKFEKNVKNSVILLVFSFSNLE